MEGLPRNLGPVPWWFHSSPARQWIITVLRCERREGRGQLAKPNVLGWRLPLDKDVSQMQQSQTANGHELLLMELGRSDLASLAVAVSSRQQ